MRLAHQRSNLFHRTLVLGLAVGILAAAPSFATQRTVVGELYSADN